ncbi:hypothetical protein HDU78_000257 [Chytriomyces hyalinus]|nr:hypothetical protein HDU78_000257 [Chytriomyces hyalinus]
MQTQPLATEQSRKDHTRTTSNASATSASAKGNSFAGFRSPLIGQRKDRRSTLQVVNTSDGESDSSTNNSNVADAGAWVESQSEDSRTAGPEAVEGGHHEHSKIHARILASRSSAIGSLARRISLFSATLFANPNATEQPPPMPSAAAAQSDTPEKLETRIFSSSDDSIPADSNETLAPNSATSLLVSLTRSLSSSGVGAVKHQSKASDRVKRRLSAKITHRAMSHGTYLDSKKPSPTIENHEFYFADFSNKMTVAAPAPSVSLPLSEADIASIHSPNGAEKTRKKFAHYGSVFIDALSKIKTAAAAASLSGGSADVTLTVINTEEESEDRSSGPRLQSRVSTSSIKITLPIENPIRIASISHKHGGVRHTSAPQISSVDVSDMFPEITDGQLGEGIVIFRIDNMRPEILDEEEHGHFCVADCYVIVSTACDDPHLRHNTTVEGLPDEMSADHLVHSIWIWIGASAEPDKRFCAAMFAVGVKNMLGVGANVKRQAEGEESQEFLDLFENRIEYHDASLAAESGLFVPEKKLHPLRLYCVHGKTAHLRMTLVNPSRSSLDSEGVFLVDYGFKILQWNGRLCNPGVKTKCRILAQVINSTDRLGKAVVSEIDEDTEDGELNSILPRDDDVGDACRAANLEALEWICTVYKVPNEGEPNDIHDMVVAKEVGTYGFTRRILQPNECLVLDGGSEIFLWIGKNASSYKKTRASEILARVIRIANRPPYLSLQRITQTNEPEPFKLYFADYIEPRAQTLQQSIHAPKKPPTRLKVDVQALYTPHPLTTVIEPASIATTDPYVDVFEAMQAVNERVLDFRAFSFEKGRFVKLEAVERGGVHVSMEGTYVFLGVYRGDGASGGVEESRMDSGMMMDESVSDRLNEAILGGSIEGLGVRGSYPVVESFESLVEKRGEVGGVAGRGGAKKHCVVYFWVGRRASRVVEQTFRFHARSEIEDAVRDLYGCASKIVHVEQGREPLELLAHWGNRSIVHWGSRKGFLARLGRMTLVGGSEEDVSVEKSFLYQVRTDWRFKTTRAIQVFPNSSCKLVSRDCFYIHSMLSEPGVGFMWTGKNATREDERKAHAVCDRIYNFYAASDSVSGSNVLPGTRLGAEGKDDSVSVASTSYSAEDSVQEISGSCQLDPVVGSKRYRIVAEHLEPRAFWEAFPGGRQAYSTGPMPPTFSGVAVGTVSSAVPQNVPRLLVCSCNKGFFSIQEVVHYDQADLDTSCCGLLDPGSHAPVFLWIGANASDVVIKLSRKAVQVWLETLAEGRSSWCGQLEGGVVVEWGVITVVEGQENDEFRSMFHGWRV